MDVGVGEYQGPFPSLSTTFILELIVTFVYEGGSMHRAPVCQLHRHRAQGFLARNETHSDTGSLPT